jgi:hypothetical protein
MELIGKVSAQINHLMAVKLASLLNEFSWVFINLVELFEN